MVLHAENTVAVTWLTIDATRQFKLQLAGLLVISAHDSVSTGCDKIITIRLVITSEQLVHFIVNAIKQFAGRGVIVTNMTLGIGGNEHIFCNAGGT